jgi:hypothetical protein
MTKVVTNTTAKMAMLVKVPKVAFDAFMSIPF